MNLIAKTASPGPDVSVPVYVALLRAFKRILIGIKGIFEDFVSRFRYFDFDVFASRLRI